MLCCRLYPVAFATSRRIAKDIELCGYHIPAGVCRYLHSLPTDGRCCIDSLFKLRCYGLSTLVARNGNKVARKGNKIACFRIQNRLVLVVYAYKVVVFSKKCGQAFMYHVRHGASICISTHVKVLKFTNGNGNDIVVPSS